MHDTRKESDHNAKGHAVGKKNLWGESVGNATKQNTVLFRTTKPSQRK